MLPDPCPLSPTQSGCKSFISVRPKSTASSTCGKKITQLGADGMRLPRYHSKTYATNYYNTARQMIYPRYTEEAWTLATKTAEANSGQERAEAEEFRYATWRTMAEIERKAKERQKLSTMKLNIDKDLPKSPYLPVDLRITWSYITTWIMSDIQQYYLLPAPLLIRQQMLDTQMQKNGDTLTCL
ncbi:unnamed protein product [Dicrocoelium dendriticum]|nr:unnamed protein product [Dicrocoelium dendriticum]